MDTNVLLKRRTALLRHIDGVRDNCFLLAERLMDNNEVEFGHMLIANGYCHDQSKFYGIEWLYLNDETLHSYPELFDAAQRQHVATNLHHPEAWLEGIHKMDRLHLAEMVCDWSARSAEFGKDLRDWIKTQGAKKFDFKVQSLVYREIKDLVDMLLDKPFK